MILQVQIYGLEILDHISILGYLLGMLPCLLTTYTSRDDPYAPGCRLLDLSLRAAAKQESDVMEFRVRDKRAVWSGAIWVLNQK